MYLQLKYFLIFLLREIILTNNSAVTRIPKTLQNSLNLVQGILSLWDGFVYNSLYLWLIAPFL